MSDDEIATPGPRIFDAGIFGAGRAGPGIGGLSQADARHVRAGWPAAGRPCAGLPARSAARPKPAGGPDLRQRAARTGRPPT